MQLKLRVGVGDALTIDVQPNDTFQDLSNRLYRLGGVKVDLRQLKSKDKPFDMSTNVMEYFSTVQNGDSSSQNGAVTQYCRLCSETIPSDPIFLFGEAEEENEETVKLFEKVNSSLPIHVSVNDHLPKQICETCHVRVDRSFDFMQKVVEAQEALEKVFHLKAKEKPVTNYNEDARCPLCPKGHFKQVDHKLRLVGKKPNEKVMRKDVVISVPRTSSNLKPDEPVTYIKQEPMDADDYYNDEIVTGYWDSGQDSEAYGMKRVRRRTKHNEDDADWTIDEEYVPVSRRGRPRGTKNKPKTSSSVDKICVICGWIGADVDMLAHAINQHCQPDLGYFPCPLCKINLVNEIILESHIDKHNLKKRDK